MTRSVMESPRIRIDLALLRLSVEEEVGGIPTVPPGRHYVMQELFAHLPVCSFARIRPLTTLTLERQPTPVGGVA
jgi:hypothetical protein